MLVIFCDGILPKKAEDIVVQDEHPWNLLKSFEYSSASPWLLGHLGAEAIGCFSPNRGWSMSVGKDREGAADVVFPGWLRK